MSVPPPRRLFTVEEYERMVEVGILTSHDRVELIEGEIVEMTPIDPPHFGAVNSLTHLLRYLDDRATVAVRGPVRLFPDSMPEPDSVVDIPHAQVIVALEPGSTATARSSRFRGTEHCARLPSPTPS